MNLTASLDDLIKEDKGPRGKERGGGGAVRRERGRERSAPYVRPGGRDRPAAPTEASAMSVFVGNMSWETDWKMLKDHMRAAGDVAHVKVIERADGRSRGCVARAARSPCTACLSRSAVVHCAGVPPSRRAAPLAASRLSRTTTPSTPTAQSAPWTVQSSTGAPSTCGLTAARAPIDRMVRDMRRDTAEM